MGEPPSDEDLAAVFATPRGELVLRAMEASWSLLTAPAIREAIKRERERWSTGGPVRTLASKGDA